MTMLDWEALFFVVDEAVVTPKQFKLRVEWDPGPTNEAVFQFDQPIFLFAGKLHVDKTLELLGLAEDLVRVYGYKIRVLQFPAKESDWGPMA